MGGTGYRRHNAVAVVDQRDQIGNARLANEIDRAVKRLVLVSPAADLHPDILWASPDNLLVSGMAVVLGCHLQMVSGINHYIRAIEQMPQSLAQRMGI
jgi:hypothetical protein